MKNLVYMAAALIALAATVNAQTNNYSIREIRDPVQLKDKINTDMGNIDTRLLGVEGTSAGGALAAGKLLVGNAAGVSAAQTVSGNMTINTSGVVTVTGASGAFVGVADVKGATLSIGSGSLKRIAGTLVWVESNVTNVLDADVTSP